MKNIVCMFSGWCEMPIDKAELSDPKTGECKTAEKWIEERGDISGLILKSFTKFNDHATNGEYTELDLSIQD